MGILPSMGSVFDYAYTDGCFVFNEAQMKPFIFVDYFKKKKLPSTLWARLLNIVVLDPDGWDRRGDYFDADWSKKITLKEFMNKASSSTCQYSEFYKGISQELRKEK